MNRLQKKAWTEFILVGVCTLIASAGVLFMAHRNSTGLDFVLIVIVTGVPTALVMYILESKKLKQFDEREKAIIQRAFSLSAVIFIAYQIIFSFAVFFLIGGGGSVQVVFMPLMFFSGLFLAQTAQSFILLTQCEKEDDE